MTTETLTLSEFLLARIKDHEGYLDLVEAGMRRHAAFSDPDDSNDPLARDRAECESKREILDMLGGRYPESEHHPRERRIRQLLALPYADHPDYREEWRP